MSIISKSAHQLPIIIGITGASGAIYGIRLLEILKDLSIPTFLIMSKISTITITQETNYSLEQVKSLASQYCPYRDMASCISSGSFKTRGMIIAPCSSKTLSAIAHSYEDNLLIRSASVVLKERRKLVLLHRETPLHQSHIENMSKVTTMGGIIFPPVIAFYNNPSSIMDIIDNTISRTLDLFDIETNLIKRWQGLSI